MKRATLLSAAAGLSGTLTNSIQRALAIEPNEGSTFWDAEHVVILMQENRSFDHAFGALRGVRGFNDPRAISLTNGNPVWVQSNAKGESYVPFRLDIKNTRATWMGSLPHSWPDQVDARNAGRHDGWLEAKRSGDKNFADMPLTLGYYNRQDIPFYYELADAFTICDQHFCSCLTGTTPNRLYLWTGTIRAQQNAESPALVLNSDADHASEVKWTTFPERLEDLGISWKIYQNELGIDVGFTEEERAWLSNFDDNPIEYFTQFNVRFCPAHRDYLEAASKTLPMEIAALKREIAATELSARAAKKIAEQIQQKTALLDQVQRRHKWSRQNFLQLSPRDRNLHEKAFSTNVEDAFYHHLSELTYRDGDATRHVKVPKGDLLHQFRRDVARGTLPTVSWVVPPEKLSDHPSSAWYGAWYVAEMLDILTQNPAVWKKTIFILTYDENDGYFDHVPPFAAPHPHRPEAGKVSKGIDTGLEYVELEQELKRKSVDEARDSPIGLGFRVPLIVASPWSRGGCVCSQVFDHTSPLQFLERLLTRKTGKEVKETNINLWRRTVCGDLTSVFQNRAADETKAPRFPPRNAFIEGIHRAQFKDLPSGYRKLTTDEVQHIRSAPRDSMLMPRQEPGVRRSCPLPYELSVDGQLNSDKERFEIRFEAGNAIFGKSAAGSPFIVFARVDAGDLRTRNYAVAAGDRLVDSWALGDFAHERYDLLVYGPNGFFRGFRGDASDPQLEIRFAYAHLADSPKSLNGDIELRAVNRDNHRSCTIDVADHAYKNGSKQIVLAPDKAATRAIATHASFGWYDFSVRVAGNPRFEIRCAGHAETGKWTFSDPAMGQVVI